MSTGSEQLSQVFSLKGDLGPPAASRRWLVTPFLASAVLHVILLAVVQKVGPFDLAVPKAGGGRTLLFQAGTVSPGEAETAAKVQPFRIEDISGAPRRAVLSPGDFPELKDRGPREPGPESQPALRYPEEELPLLSNLGLSERSRAFVRDGELNASDPAGGFVSHLPPGRKIGPPVIMGAAMAPRLRDEHDRLVVSISEGAAEPAAGGTAAQVALRAPRTTLFLPEPVPTAVSRDAESLLGDKGPPLPVVQMPVDVKIDVYAEPGSEHRFFRLTIAQKQGHSLPALAKNVLFVIDISASIRLDMLKAIRDAVEKSSPAFNRGDRFNVVRFSEQSYKMFDGFVPASNANVARAARWIQKEPGQVRTDVYSALKDVIAGIETEADESGRPVNICLISDGNPTAGIQDIRHIVNDLSEVTRPKYSIFAVSPGALTANSYLLDLLAYRNRGRFVRAESAEAAEARILELLAEHKDPVLVDLRAQYGNLEAQQVCPETLPNLYAGRPIIIYGRCLPGDTVAVRIIGTGVKERREFLYTGTLPEVMTGDESIPRQWARGRIHHLTSLIAREGEKEEYLEEIRRLTERYKLESPYPQSP